MDEFDKFKYLSQGTEEIKNRTNLALCDMKYRCPTDGGALDFALRVLDVAAGERMLAVFDNDSIRRILQLRHRGTNSGTATSSSPYM